MKTDCELRLLNLRVDALKKKIKDEEKQIHHLKISIMDSRKILNEALDEIKELEGRCKCQES